MAGIPLDAALWVKLTEWGQNRCLNYFHSRRLPTPDFVIDDHGRVRFTLREFAQVFGSYLGRDQPPVVEGDLELI